MAKYLVKNKKRLIFALLELLALLPSTHDNKRGYIEYEKNKNNYTVIVPPACFMATINPDFISVEKREYWNDECTEYCVKFIANQNLTIKTILNIKYLRDANYLAKRR